MIKLKNKKVENDGSYWCKKCGAKDNITGYYTQTEYGMVQIVDALGNTGDYDADDWDNFEVYEYRCEECDYTASKFETLMTDDIEEVWDKIYPGEEPWKFNPDQKQKRKKSRKQ